MQLFLLLQTGYVDFTAAAADFLRSVCDIVGKYQHVTHTWRSGAVPNKPDIQKRVTLKSHDSMGFRIFLKHALPNYIVLN